VYSDSVSKIHDDTTGRTVPHDLLSNIQKSNDDDVVRLPFSVVDAVRLPFPVASVNRGQSAKEIATTTSSTSTSYEYFT
jgi:hypothetical protein